MIVVLRFDKAASNEFARVIALAARPTAEPVPFIRRVTKLPTLGDFASDSALFQIFPRGFPNFSLGQIFVEPFRSFGM